MSCLNRAEEVLVPSLPFEFTKTAAPPEEVAPLIPRDECGGDIRIADPDGVALACYPTNVVADIDIITSSRQVRAGDVAQGRVVAAGVIEKRHVATGCVAVAGV